MSVSPGPTRRRKTRDIRSCGWPPNSSTSTSPAGDARFEVPLDLHGTPFQVKAWRLLATVPYGSTVSYRQQALLAGDANKARAVGAANGRNPVSIILPCHRVIGASGALTGFAGGLDAKRSLLEFEARVVKEGPIPFPG